MIDFAPGPEFVDCCTHITCRAAFPFYSGAFNAFMPCFYGVGELILQTFWIFPKAPCVHGRFRLRSICTMVNCCNGSGAARSLCRPDLQRRLPRRALANITTCRTPQSKPLLQQPLELWQMQWPCDDGKIAFIEQHPKQMRLLQLLCSFI